MNKINKLIIRSLRHKNIDEWFGLASNISLEISESLEKPGIFRFMSCGFSCFNALKEHMGIDCDELYKNWKPIIPGLLAQHTYSIMSEYKVKQTAITSGYLGSVATFCQVDGCIFCFTGSEDALSNCLVLNDDFDKCAAKLADLLWKDKIIKIDTVENEETNGDINSTYVIGKYEWPSISNEMVDYYSNKMMKFIDNGVNRAILLYGDPGTGKSTLAISIANNLNFRTLRLGSSAIGDIKFDNFINVLRPDCVVIDDLDYADYNGEILHLLEIFRQTVKLVIVTVNDKDGLSERLLRPGRIDDLIEVNKLDESSVKKILGDEHIDLFDIVKDWPVAYINELIYRSKALTKEEAIGSLKDLQERIDRAKLVFKNGGESFGSAVNMSNILGVDRGKKKNKRR